MCVWRTYTERGIIGGARFHGRAVSSTTPRYLLVVPPALEPLAVLVEPMSVVEKAVRQADLIQRRLAAWSPTTALVLGAGPIGLLGTLLLRARGLEVVTVARRPAPSSASAIIEACGARYVSTRETPLPELAPTLPPIDLIFEATGSSQTVAEAMGVLGNNGVLVLLSVTGGDAHRPVPIDAINREFVLGNKLMVGSVNAAREDFAAGVASLGRFETALAGSDRPLDHPPPRRLRRRRPYRRATADGIKTVIEFN